MTRPTVVPHRASAALLFVIVSWACSSPVESIDPTDAATTPQAVEPRPAQSSTVPDADGAQMPDFDALADAAIAGRFEDMGANTRLYRPLFQLEQWHLLAFPDSKTVPPGLNIETHDGKQWVMAFTDHERLRAYATARGQLNADGSVMAMAIPPLTSFGFLESLQAEGIFGVRFNQGEHGWFSPIRDLRAIHAFVEANKEL